MVSMSITPSTASVLGIGDIIPVQYTAYGTFIHPSETRNVTTEVTWTSSVLQVATVNNSGLVTPSGIACGGTIITATAGKNLIGTGSSQAVITAQATFTVADPSVTGCPAQ
jgi:hypothetical protein